jgi:hypothetical protein
MQLKQVIDHGYKQFICEIAGHDISHAKKRFMEENLTLVRCERCSVPLNLSYTDDRRRIKIREISV